MLQAAHQTDTAKGKQCQQEGLARFVFKAEFLPHKLHVIPKVIHSGQFTWLSLNDFADDLT